MSNGAVLFFLCVVGFHVLQYNYWQGLRIERDGFPLNEEDAFFECTYERRTKENGNHQVLDDSERDLYVDTSKLDVYHDFPNDLDLLVGRCV